MVKTLKLFISAIVAAGLVFLLARSFNFTDFIQLIYGVNWFYIFFAFLLYILVNLARSLRFRLLLGNSAMFRDIVSVSFIHNFLTSLLPFRTGELSYLYLLKKYRGISFATSAGTLFLSRFFDILIVANLVILSVFFVSQDRLPMEIAVIALAFAIIALTLSLVLIFFTGFFLKAISFLFRTRLFFGVGAISNSFGNISSVFLLARDKNYFLKLFSFSLLIWLLNFGVGVLLFRALHFDFNFLETVFIFSLPMLISEFSPIQSFANLGIYEWSLVGGMIIFGISKNIAAQSSIFIHGIEFIFSLLIGLVGFLVILTIKNEKHY